MTPGELTAYAVVFGLGTLAGLVLTVGVIAMMRAAQCRDTAELEAELSSAMRSRDEWQDEALRLRAVLDGKRVPIAPKFPRATAF
jgi:hypothetical protein